jgi:putative restriction endonuclease
MRYWWVNQNQTYRHEIAGGIYGRPSAMQMAREIRSTSFMDTRILAVGFAQSYCWESPKPLEFGKSGENWEGIGWRVKVHFTELAKKVRPPTRAVISSKINRGLPAHSPSIAPRKRR